MPDNLSKAETFKAETEDKIKELILEFGEGRISQEQFNILYTRYNDHLAIANEALDSNDLDDLKAVQNSLPTYAIRAGTLGKAIGVSIYHHRSGMMIETLGAFDVPANALSTILNELSHKVESREYIEPRSVKISNYVWLLFAAKNYTSVITLFQNEPSQAQMREMARLHHDFEQANERFLAQDAVDQDRLAHPFLVFVKKKLQQ